MSYKLSVMNYELLNNDLHGLATERLEPLAWRLCHLLDSK